MPLKKGSSKKTISSNIRELKRDNKKKGKARGANGKLRNQKEIVAIALSTAKKSKKRKKK